MVKITPKLLPGGVMSRFALLAIAALVALPAAPAVAGAAAQPDPAPVDFHQWRSPELLFAGTRDGLLPTLKGLRIGRPAGRIDHTEPSGTKTYDYGTWTSPFYRQR